MKMASVLDFAQLEQYTVDAVLNKDTEDLSFLRPYLGNLKLVNYLDLKFSNGALIIEQSGKIHCKNVDKLDLRQQRIEEMLINKRSQGSDEAARDADDAGPDAEVAHPRQRAPRRRKRVRNCVDEDEFQNIGNEPSLNARKHDEPTATKTTELIFNHQNVCGLTKRDAQRKRPSVRLQEMDDELKESRLRDYVLNHDLMLTRELFDVFAMTDESRYVEPEDLDYAMEDYSAHPGFESVPGTPARSPAPSHYSDFSEASIRVGQRGETWFEELGDPPNPNGRGKLLDEPLLSDPVQSDTDDIIPTKKAAPGDTLRNSPCPECPEKKPHTKGGKKCTSTLKLGPLNDFFYPHMNKAPAEDKFANVPDKELIPLFRRFVKMQNQRRSRRISADDLPSSPPEDDFGGFDNIEEDDDLGRDVDLSDGVGHMDFDLPMPTQADSVNTIVPAPLSQSDTPEKGIISPNDVMSVSSGSGEAEFNLRKRFELNQEMGVRVNDWHNNLRGKIQQAECRGAFNLDKMADQIMAALSQGVGTEPVMSISELVSGRERREVALVFLTCLQLTNEGNVGITKRPPTSIDVKRLRTVRVKEVDNYNPDEVPLDDSSRPGDKKKRKRAA